MISIVGIRKNNNSARGRTGRVRHDPVRTAARSRYSRTLGKRRNHRFLVAVRQRCRLTVYSGFDPSRRDWTYHTSFSVWSSLTVVRQGARVPSTPTYLLYMGPIRDTSWRILQSPWCDSARRPYRAVTGTTPAAFMDRGRASTHNLIRTLTLP